MNKVVRKYRICVVLLIASNLLLLGWALFNHFTWSIQFTASVDYATELGYWYGYQVGANKKWPNEQPNFTRLHCIESGASEKRDMWSLATNRGYALILSKETTAIDEGILNAAVVSWNSTK